MVFRRTFGRDIDRDKLKSHAREKNEEKDNFLHGAGQCLEVRRLIDPAQL